MSRQNNAYAPAGNNALLQNSTGATLDMLLSKVRNTGREHRNQGPILVVIVM